MCSTMGMTRKLTTVAYEATRNLTVSRREALPPNHLARFVADVSAPLALSSLSVRSGMPNLWFGLLRLPLG